MLQAMDYDGADADYDVLYDIPYEGELTADYYYSNFIESYTLKDLWQDCLVPTFTDGFSSVFVIFMCCLLLRFTASLGFLPKSSIHFTSGALGVYCLHHMFGTDCVYIALFTFVGYLSIAFAHHIKAEYRGIVSAATCFLFLILCELLFVEKVVWHKIRGSQMVIAMKLISLAFDIDHGKQSLPSSLECFGYLFSVGTVIFGPWVSFSTYCRILLHQSKNTQWAFRIVQSGLSAFFFLSLSTCWTAWFLQYTQWKWLAAYRDALSFRSSHYFVCYISESLAVASGISATNGAWGYPVAHPQNIEIPHSLVEVVTCWNLPIHAWLKNYVFRTAKSFGNFVAVLLTYVASSLLHGLNFQLAAVLLSLGFYTYIEHVLRKKLSRIFDACILAKKCKRDCDHQYKNNHPYVLAINISFGFLAVFHLAYLGVMFDSSSSIQEEGYSMQHTLEKWSELGFASHWVALVTYVFYFLI